MNTIEIFEEAMKELEYLGLANDVVAINHTLGELELDELDVVEFVMALEEHFNVELNDADLEAGTNLTMYDICELVEKELNKK